MTDDRDGEGIATKKRKNSQTICASFGHFCGRSLSKTGDFHFLPALFLLKLNLGLARVSCAAADEHAVHIDVIENCGTERIGGSVGVLGLVKYDRYPLNSTGERNKRECRRVESHHDASRPPPKPRPAVSDRPRIRRSAATAHEE